MKDLYNEMEENMWMEDENRRLTFNPISSIQVGRTLNGMEDVFFIFRPGIFFHSIVQTCHSSPNAVM